MALVICIANHKGGVAKTASVAALGTVYAAAGQRVLMVDLDTQANLTYSFVDMSNGAPSRYMHDAISERRGLPRVAVRENLYLAPSGLEMTLIETAMYSMRRREYVLCDLLAPVRDSYDVILVDCPPSLSILTTNALAACDRVTVPVVADQLSYYGLKMMKAYVESLRDINASLRIDDIFITRFDARERLARRWESALREEFGDVVMKAMVRRNVKVGEAVSSLNSVVEYCPSCAGAMDYVELARELSARAARRNSLDID